jgi:triphosphoribosyl-dephospho-CoA synthase
MSQVAEKVFSRLYYEACMAELSALKPGNVHIFADGHGMVVQDFIKSADASMDAISKSEIGVGERILGAVEQTWQAVACNTNLGIILLAAPLIQTSLIWTSLTEKSCEHGALSEAKLGQVLQNLSVEDAKFAFKAIQLASPAGLGSADEHDVHHVPDDTLLAAMQAAASRDLIAQQYANGFADVFAGVQVYVEHLAKWERPAWAVTAVYLSFLAKFEDSHIARKYGQDVAKSIQKQAQQHYAELTSLENPKLYQASLLTWDAELKKQGINPGTSADLTVATILANSLMNI